MNISAKTKFILYNIIAAIVVIFILGAFVLSRLDNYTQHGHSISVPSFYGLTPEKAEEIAKQNYLRIQVIDSLYEENAEPGTILEQYPPIGSGVKENRMIHFTINAHNAEKVAFPNLQNSAYRQTLQTLESRGFKIGHVELAPSEFKNLVLTLKYHGQQILPGTLLPKGSTIDIVLGSGNGDNSVYVPQMIGKTLREATFMARSAYLNVYKVTSDGSLSDKSDQNSAIVYQQTPAPNEMVRAGSPIYLQITLKKEKVNVPDSLMIEE